MENTRSSLKRKERAVHQSRVMSSGNVLIRARQRREAGRQAQMCGGGREPKKANVSFEPVKFVPVSCRLSLMSLLRLEGSTRTSCVIFMTCTTKIVSLTPPEMDAYHAKSLVRFSRRICSGSNPWYRFWYNVTPLLHALNIFKIH